MNRQPIYYFAALFVGIFVFCLDQLTKIFTHSYLPIMNGFPSYPYGGIGVFKNFFGIEFSISHQVNRGAAWGMFADYQIPLLYLRIALIIGLLAYLLFFNRYQNWVFPFTLIIAGALSNVLDFFLYGHVIDMLHFVLWNYDFPVFNLADSAIFIGISLLFLISTIEKKKSQQSYKSSLWE